MNLTTSNNTDHANTACPPAYREIEPEHAAFQEMLSLCPTDARFMELATAVAHNNGCELLFEVPGIMFSRPLARVAAIESRSPTNTEPFYVLYERITGSICILSGADIPTEVRGFVASYKAVLKGLS